MTAPPACAIVFRNRWYKRHVSTLPRVVEFTSSMMALIPLSITPHASFCSTDLNLELSRLAIAHGVASGSSQNAPHT
jgi:hypothetical protein